MQNGAEFAAADPRSQLHHLRMKAAVVAQAECDARTLHRANGPFRAFPRERERLLAEDVLLGRRRHDHLMRVQRMRRGEDHGIHFWIREERLVRIDELEFLRVGEGLYLGRLRARGAGNEADLLTILLHGFDQCFSPPAEADNSRADHD